MNTDEATMHVTTWYTVNYTNVVTLVVTNLFHERHKLGQ